MDQQSASKPDVPSASSVDSLAAQLNAALERNDKAAFLHVLAQMAHLYGFSKTAREAKINRTALYRTVSAAAEPRFSTVIAVLRALGWHVRISRD